MLMEIREQVRLLLVKKDLHAMPSIPIMRTTSIVIGLSEVETSATTLIHVLLASKLAKHTFQIPQQSLISLLGIDGQQHPSLRYGAYERQRTNIR